MKPSETSMYDVIIVGGGPAGLSVASELAKLYKVLVIEKGKIGHTDRSWFTPGEVMAKQSAEIQEFTKGGIKRILEHTPTISILWDVLSPWESSPEWKCYPYVDQDGILDYWAKKIVERGSTVIEGVSFTDYDVQNGIVTVRAIGTEAPFAPISKTARLLIDASGYNSPVANRSQINRTGYKFWSVYGWEVQFDDITKLKHPATLGNMELGDFMLWNSFKTVPENPDATLADFRPIMEYEVLDEKTVYFFILYFHREKASKEFMIDQFNNIMKNTEEMAPFVEGKWNRERFGWYPSMGISQSIAKDNVAFIGDSGCWTIADGYGMSFILNNYVEYSKNLSHILKGTDLSAKQLNRATAFNIRQRYQVLLDQVVLDFMSYATPTLLDKFTNIMFTYTKGKMIEEMFILKLNEKDCVTLLLKILKVFSWKELFSVVNAGMDRRLLVKVSIEFVKVLFVNGFRKITRQKALDMGYTFQLIKGVENA